uniref:Uncharacterized protein n=1 Tax=Romanomermis culicivorax TaxID=13658 RepID=A0A915J7Q8_ROMCU
MADFQSAEITPNIIPNAPKNKLMVNYEGTILENGMNFKTNQLRFAPRVQYAGADPEGTYSLVMIDPDNLSREKPTVAEWLHWLVLNIPASNIIDGIMGGQVLMAYGSPGPQPRTGKLVCVRSIRRSMRMSLPLPKILQIIH